MKKNIHPAYNVIDVKLTNGETIQIRSTMKRPEGMQLDVDPLTHPAWTGGNQRLLDTGGRVSRFKEKFKGFGF